MKRILSWSLVITLCLISTQTLAKTVKLGWDSSPTPTVSGYIILISLSQNMTNPSEQDVGNVLNYTVKELRDQDEHWFCVKAYDNNGNKSVCSNIVKSPAILPELDFEVDIGIIK